MYELMCMFVGIALVISSSVKLEPGFMKFAIFMAGVFGIPYFMVTGQGVVIICAGVIYALMKDVYK